MASAWAKSWAISGQSDVHTGSRKVSATVLPRRLARVTVRPRWSVRVNAGATKLAGAGAPSTASEMMGSALGLTDAEAMGTAPTRTITMAARAASTRPV